MIHRKHLEELVLARLSVTTKSPLSASDVAKSLFSFVSLQLTGSEWRSELDGALIRLREAGDLEPKRLVLTAAGRTRLAMALKTDTVPRARNWADFRRKYVRRLIAGSDHSEPNGVPPAFAIVARKLGLPADAARTEGKLANAWLTAELGIRTRKVTLDSVRAALLARALGVPVRPSLTEVLRLSASKLTGAKSAKPDHIIQALANDWLQASGNGEPAESPPPPPQPPEQSTPDIIGKIRSALRSPAVKRFGPNKVFIASVWQSLCADRDVRLLGEAGFKSLLVEAHQRGELTLSRADLVSAMDPVDVAASETQHLNATYHFIQIRGDQQ